MLVSPSPQSMLAKIPNGPLTQFILHNFRHSNHISIFHGLNHVNTTYSWCFLMRTSAGSRGILHPKSCQARCLRVTLQPNSGGWRVETVAHPRSFAFGGWLMAYRYLRILSTWLHTIYIYIHNIWLYPYLGWSRLTKVSNIKIRFLELFWCSTRILKSNRGVAWNANFDRVLHVGQIHKRSAHSTVSRATTWECWLNQQTLGFDGKNRDSSMTSLPHRWLRPTVWLLRWWKFLDRKLIVDGQHLEKSTFRKILKRW